MDTGVWFHDVSLFCYTYPPLQVVDIYIYIYIHRFYMIDFTHDLLLVSG